MAERDRERMLFDTSDEESRVTDWLAGPGTWVVFALIAAFVLFFVWDVVLSPILHWMF